MWWCETYRWEIYDEIDENRLFMANIAWLLVSYYSLMIMVPYALYIPFANLQYHHKLFFNWRKESKTNRLKIVTKCLVSDENFQTDLY